MALKYSSDSLLTLSNPYVLHSANTYLAKKGADSPPLDDFDSLSDDLSTDEDDDDDDDDEDDVLNNSALLNELDEVRNIIVTSTLKKKSQETLLSYKKRGEE